MKKHLILASLLCLAACASSPKTPVSKDSAVFVAGKMAEGAPPQLMHWGQLVGQWATTEEVLRADGTAWDPAGTADWDMFWSFNGWGIQDNYTSPPLSEPMADESKRQRGTNLRIYNPKDKKWIITWLTVGSNKPTGITAVSTKDKIVMLLDEPGPKGNYSRITFFDMTDNSFEWKLEQSKDQLSWQEVYRIHGRKK